MNQLKYKKNNQKNTFNNHSSSQIIKLILKYLKYFNMLEKKKLKFKKEFLYYKKEYINYSKIRE